MTRVLLLLVVTMTASLWSGGVTWGADADEGVWMPDGASPSGRPVPDVAVAGAKVNNVLQSASWSLGPSDPLADLSPGNASFTFVGEVDAEPGDDVVVSTGWGAMWAGRVESVTVTLDTAGDYWTTIAAVDKVGELGLAQLRKDNGKVGTLVEIIAYLGRRAGVRMQVTDASTGTYGLVQLQRFAYFSETFTGTVLEYINTAARSSNAMVALQPDGSLRTMTREALTSTPSTVTLDGSDSPVQWTRTLAWGNDVNRWSMTQPDGTDLPDQSIPSDILAHGERSFTVENYLDVDTGSGVQLPFLEWFAYIPQARWSVTNGEFVVKDLSQSDLLTLAPLDWITVLGENWQVMSLSWTIDGPRQPMRLTITADNLLTVMSGIDPGPVISGVTAYDITGSAATITWDLSEPGTGYVEYGTTTAYGSETIHEESFTYSTHIQTISGLTPGTTYHYRVRSSAPSGDPVETISPDHTFETTAVSATVYGPGVGGIGLSNTVLTTGQNPQIFGFRATRTGYISSMRFYYLGASVGYGAGTGGTWDLKLYAADSSGNPTGAAIATQSVAASATDQPGRLMTCGASWAVTAGSRYVWHFTNTDASPGSNYFSPDYWNGFADPDTDPVPTWDDGYTMGPKWADAELYHKYYTGSAWVTRRGYLPVIDMTYDDSSHQGMSYGETVSRNDPAQTGKVNGSNEMVRVRWTQGTTSAVVGAWFHLAKVSGVTDDLVITLRDSGDSVLGTITVAAASIPTSVTPSTSQNADPYWGSERAWVGGTFSSPITLTSGQEYRLRAASAGGAFWVSRFRTMTEYSYSRDCTWPDDGVSEYTSDGSTWTTSGWNYASSSDLIFAMTLA